MKKKKGGQRLKEFGHDQECTDPPNPPILRGPPT